MDGRVRKRYVSDLRARTSFRRKGSDELIAYICHPADLVSFTLGGLVLAVWLRLGIPIRSPRIVDCGDAGTVHQGARIDGSLWPTDHLEEAYHFLPNPNGPTYCLILRTRRKWANSGHPV